MAKPELGTKRIDPETGKKFYDLNRDPIISPYTGNSYPRSYFDANSENVLLDEEDSEGLDVELDKADFISLEEVDEVDKATVGLEDDDLHVGDDDDDAAFLVPDDDEVVADILTGTSLDEEA